MKKKIGVCCWRKKVKWHWKELNFMPRDCHMKSASRPDVPVEPIEAQSNID